MRDERSVAYGVDHADDDAVANEEARLGLLADRHDTGSAKLLYRVGIASGMRCLEVGAGQGSMARWIATEVGPSGSVLATDIDLTFVGKVPPNVELRQHDIANDDLPTDEFDLVHARAVLQHVPARGQALQNMIGAAKRGGWIVVEDIDWVVFDEQPLPEPFRTLHLALRTTYSALADYDGNFGRKMLRAMIDAGLSNVDSHGRVSTMRGGQPSAEWYIMALERSIPMLVEQGAIDADTAQAGLAQSREADFVVLSPLRISAWGQKR